jgi:hypothetical protein
MDKSEDSRLASHFSITLWQNKTFFFWNFSCVVSGKREIQQRISNKRNKNITTETPYALGTAREFHAVAGMLAPKPGPKLPLGGVEPLTSAFRWKKLGGRSYDCVIETIESDPFPVNIYPLERDCYKPLWDLWWTLADA